MDNSTDYPCPTCGELFSREHLRHVLGIDKPATITVDGLVVGECMVRSWLEELKELREKPELEALVGRQQLEIERLKAELSVCKEGLRDISRHLCCIGGPLNDNRLQFNHDQIQFLHKINNITEDGYWGE